MAYFDRGEPLRKALGSQAGRRGLSMLNAQQKLGRDWLTSAARGTPHDLDVQEVALEAGESPESAASPLLAIIAHFPGAVLKWTKKEGEQVATKIFRRGADWNGASLAQAAMEVNGP